MTEVCGPRPELTDEDRLSRVVNTKSVSRLIPERERQNHRLDLVEVLFDSSFNPDSGSDVSALPGNDKHEQKVLMSPR